MKRSRLPKAPHDGFDYTLHIRHVAQDMVGRLEELSHIDLSQVAIRFCQARKSTLYGMQASLTPLRFQGGERDRKSVV